MSSEPPALCVAVNGDFVAVGYHRDGVKLYSIESGVCQYFDSMSASQFSELFNLNFNIEELVSHFNLICPSVLDFVAPFKDKRFKNSPQPWINYSIN